MGLASKFTIWLIGLLCLAVAKPALANEAERECVGRRMAGVGSVYFPELTIPYVHRTYPLREKIEITDEGQVTLNLQPIEFAQLQENLAATLDHNLTEVTINPAEAVPLSKVVPILEVLNRLNHCATSFVGNEMHSQVFAGTRLATAHSPPPLPSFTILYDAMVSVEFVPGAQNGETSDEQTGCHAFFMRQQVDSFELQQLAFDRLSHVVNRYGGLQLTPRKAMNAIIQARASTPWRCVAGAIYNVQVAGYRNADLVVLPDDQPVPADPPPPTPTVTAVDLFEVGYGPSDGETRSRCHIYFDRRQVAFGDRVVEVFAGGNVAVHSDVSPQLPDIEAAQSGIAAPTAAVRARQDTPRRCVAGAIYGIQTAGYANVGFISSPED